MGIGLHLHLKKSHSDIMEHENQKDDKIDDSNKVIFKNIDADTEQATEIESMCMSCGKNVSVNFGF